MHERPVIFLGTNSNLLLYCEVAEKAGLTIAGIVDNDYAGNTEQLHGLLVLGSEQDADFLQTCKDQYWFFIATNWSPDPEHVRDCQKRQHLIDVVTQHQLTCVNIVDPSAQVSRHAKLGQGIYIGALSYIEPNVTIEDHAQIHYGAGLSHGSRVGTNTVIQRQAGIAADIGANCYIGMWCKLFKSPLLKVGDNAIINPGLYVARDIEPQEYVRLTKESRRVASYPAAIQ